MGLENLGSLKEHSTGEEIQPANIQKRPTHLGTLMFLLVL